MTRAHSLFPDPRLADDYGLVAETDAMTPELLVDAYSHGIFPWSDDPVRWFSPDPRAIFLRERVRLPHKLGKIIRRHGFHVTLDQAFTDVVVACAETHRHEGEWISSGFVRAYSELHAHGQAHSVEVWQGDALVGGLYGVQLRGLFAGESMFYRVANASKVAFAALLAQLDAMGTLLMDAQVINEHTASLGAVLVTRDDYLYLLEHAMRADGTHDGKPWSAEPPPFLHRRVTEPGSESGS
ncbi:MAG: leucyl/phenylalanyl-tRNA--protein transferase [Myxococcota bacterium]